MDLPKHVVISRKGFDSEHGCIPSPILSDGTMISLPIPGAEGTVSYGDLSLNGHSFGKLVTDLKAKRKTRNKEIKRLSATDRAHLDPDLIFKLRQRKPGWRPAFGPGSKEVTILLEQGVGKGDLFIFFGWFRRCELYGGAYHRLSRAPNVHVMFGYLRVGDIIRLSYDHVPEWAKDHPHLHFSNFKNNTLFVAADCLGIQGVADLPGAAAFAKFTDKLQLTAPGMTRSWWRLPKWFYPKPGTPSLSYHESHDRWRLQGDVCLLQSAARGQEFVLDVKHSPEAIEWAADLIRQGMAA
jgi:hypothetical protein